MQVTNKAILNPTGPTMKRMGRVGIPEVAGPPFQISIQILNKQRNRFPALLRSHQFLQFVPELGHGFGRGNHIQITKESFTTIPIVAELESQKIQV
jgi:hypothetical protein